MTTEPNARPAVHLGRAVAADVGAARRAAIRTRRPRPAASTIRERKKLPAATTRTVRTTATPGTSSRYALVPAVSAVHFRAVWVEEFAQVLVGVGQGGCEVFGFAAAGVGGGGGAAGAATDSGGGAVE